MSTRTCSNHAGLKFLVDSALHMCVLILELQLCNICCMSQFIHMHKYYI